MTSSQTPPPRGVERRGPRWRRRLIRWLLVSSLILTLALFAALAWVYLIPFPEQALSPADSASVQLRDRDGDLLREVLSERAGRAQWLRYDELEPLLVQAAIATEDQRFDAHLGVDPLAIGRATADNLRGGRVVSGASTITMQVVRQIWPHTRSLSTKLSEAVWALRLERALSKREIMTQYLNRVPFGNQLFGVEAAAQAYLGKSARALSPAEAAFIIGLPQSPTRYNPWRHLERAQQRQRWVIDRMHAEGVLTAEEATQAKSEPLRLQRRSRAFRAPHLVDHIVQRLRALAPPLRAQIARLDLAVDLDLQEKVEGIVEGHLEKLRDRQVSNVSAVVLDNATGEVLAMVGSRDFFDEAHQGQVNGARALRQPGSALKPFTYALAFERGWTPATLIADVPTHYQTTRGSYNPQNFDLRFRGPMRARTALANSLNVPAVRALDHIGVDTLLGWLRSAEVGPLAEDPDHYGLALTLGAGEVRLIDLAAAYMMLARGGEWIAPRYIHRATGHDGGALAWPPKRAPRRLLREDTVSLITDILSDNRARALAFGLFGPLAFPFDVAAKTGTSSDFRDIWTFGYTRTYTVGVWVGNFDGAPMRQVSGISGAAPIFRDIVLALHQDAEPAPFSRHRDIEEVEVCSLSGALPGPDCPHRVKERFLYRQLPEHTCDVHQRLRVDRANGLLAGPGCPVETTEETVAVVLPPEYDAWLNAQGQTLPPRAFSPRCPSQRSASPHGDLRILHPVAESEYLFDPSIPPSQQRLQLLASAGSDVDAVVWRMDGAELARTVRPFQTSWPLSRGEHSLEAVAYSAGQVVGRVKRRVRIE